MQTTKHITNIYIYTKKWWTSNGYIYTNQVNINTNHITRHWWLI